MRTLRAESKPEEGAGGGGGGGGGGIGAKKDIEQVTNRFAGIEFTETRSEEKIPDQLPMTTGESTATSTMDSGGAAAEKERGVEATAAEQVRRYVCPKMVCVSPARACRCHM